jgi:hypothetical protein
LLSESQVETILRIVDSEHVVCDKPKSYWRVGNAEYQSTALKHGRYGALNQLMNESVTLGMLVLSKRIVILRLLKDWLRASKDGDILFETIIGRSLIERVAYFNYFTRQLRNNPLPKNYKSSEEVFTQIDKEFVAKIKRALFQMSSELSDPKTIDLRKTNFEKYSKKENFLEVLGIQEKVESIDLTPLNILTPITQLDKKIMGVKNSYFFLSEFVHPNFGDLFSATKSVRRTKNEFGDPLFQRTLSLSLNSATGDFNSIFVQLREILIEIIEHYEKLVLEADLYSNSFTSLTRKGLHLFIKENGLKYLNLRKGTQCPCLSGKRIFECIR